MKSLTRSLLILLLPALSGCTEIGRASCSSDVPQANIDAAKLLIQDDLGIVLSPGKDQTYRAVEPVQCGSKVTITIIPYFPDGIIAPGGFSKYEVDLKSDKVTLVEAHD
jgi:hypothetical protein